MINFVSHTSLNALSISIPELFQVCAIITKLSPSWKDFSKRMMHKSEDYSLDNLMKHLRIEEETRIRDKQGKFGQSVHYVSAGGSCHKGKSGGKNKKNFGPKKQCNAPFLFWKEKEGGSKG
uniref:Uncharacterized protein n=1 Tax=Lactuca sativa TaxID=4236 RepID=A0A9R1VBC0_LACSA|nr:hypothetical protein LSAT_V11C600310780 [Lactuca sativa]